ncbi:MAG: SgcJ/EcaC family oxidoreductase [Candidatus Sulfotelmatobacter sp.]
MMRIAIWFALFPLLLMAQTGVEADEYAIRAVMDRFMDAWNHHDAEAFAAVFSQDADFTNIRGMGATGRAKIEAFHAPVFATIFSKSHQEYTDIKTRFLRPDVAAVDVRWKMTGAMDPQGNLRDRDGLLNFVMEKNAGRWEIVVLHNLELSAPPPTK